MKSRRPFPFGHRPCLLALAALLAASGPVARAFTVGIAPGTRAVYLQVGTGTMTGGTFNSGGVPGTNTSVNTVSVNVPAAALGSGTPLLMTTNSTVTASAWNGFAFCNTPATTGQVYIGGFYRVPGTTGAAATLTVSTPFPLADGKGDTIPFSSIAWTSSGNGDATPTIPSGGFSGGSQNLLSITRNTWFESCMAFRYLNTQVVPAGLFKGQAIFTLTAP
ncbi:hypothetical protein SRS16CHR_00652 [Variovorax sp. SRS16]|uniref:hypothetical protein n=1 Tax=Variovorax sp. SRS16 TaxID=282217 RepID=UPI001315B20E|nr:hypothetical protein [Variovorax sp. SRS16]VTU13561.1 hypothetical protein SRS16CHR_00652 [Variovorax sp. SRS16]